MTRREFQMTDEDLETLLDASKPVICMKIGSYIPPPPQENANRAWAVLGRKMGFSPMSVKPVRGRGNKVFTAEADAEIDDDV